MRVGAVGDVVDQPDRQADQRRVVVDRVVEPTSGAAGSCPANTRLPTLQSSKLKWPLRSAPRQMPPVARATGLRDRSRHHGHIRIARRWWRTGPRSARRARRGPRRPAGDDRARARRRGPPSPSSSARREAFLRKSDGPSASPRKRRTSPVDAPSSYPLIATVSETPGVWTSVVVSAPEPRPPENSTTRSGATSEAAWATTNYAPAFDQAELKPTVRRPELQFRHWTPAPRESRRPACPAIRGRSEPAVRPASRSSPAARR